MDAGFLDVDGEEPDDDVVLLDLPEPEFVGAAYFQRITAVCPLFA